MAYKYDITTSGKTQNEHQSSPTWVLTFIRWAERDTLRTKPTNGITSTSVRDHILVVESDCIEVTTSMNKGTLTPNMSATLLMTDINYLTAVAPGDFCFVNMVNWPDKARDITIRAHNQQAINNQDDGFKGIFKVQSVRQILMTDPDNGNKHIAFKITGFAFTEFNNTIYFNPCMISVEDTQNVAFFASNMGSAFASLASDKGITNVQDIINALIKMMIGTGFSDTGSHDKVGNIKTPNTLFQVPTSVGNLLGTQNVTAAKDIYNYLFGIQQYSGGTDMPSGMNPSNIATSDPDTNFFPMDTNIQGNAIQKAEYWNQVKLWSILNQFVNAPLNEMFTTFRIDPTGLVMPTVILRQTPFTNMDFDAGGFAVTRFLTLPRWNLDPAMVMNLDIGRDEAARVNFVQIFGRSAIGNVGFDIVAETAARNYLYDADDVKRSGLRPMVVNSTFDEQNGNNPNFQSPKWARIVGDAVIGGHLKLNGSVMTFGIQEPIAVGDNLQFNNVVYHIESITHSCQISNGKKIFRTTISLSSGILASSNINGVKYAQMDYGNAYRYRDADANSNLILPGVSESQSTVGRGDNIDSTGKTDKPFLQPNTTTSIKSSTRFVKKAKKDE
jgi:hypothetical protein